MRDHQAVFPIATMCRVLDISRSGFHAWMKRPLSARALRDAALLAEIRVSHARSDETYGAPRILGDLQELGHWVGQKRVARLMHANALWGVSRRRGTTTTRRGRDETAASDLVQRAFTAAAPNHLWVADITYIPTWAGFLYLAVVLDAFSRRIVGWAMATHLKTALVLDALEMAHAQRRPAAVIHHSDHGCQGGFNRSSQHLTREGCDIDEETAVFRPCRARHVAIAGPALGGTA